MQKHHQSAASLLLTQLQESCKSGRQMSLGGKLHFTLPLAQASK